MHKSNIYIKLCQQKYKNRNFLTIITTLYKNNKHDIGRILKLQHYIARGSLKSK